MALLTTSKAQSTTKEKEAISTHAKNEFEETRFLQKKHFIFASFKIKKTVKNLTQAIAIPKWILQAVTSVLSHILTTCDQQSAETNLSTKNISKNLFHFSDISRDISG